MDDIKKEIQKLELFLEILEKDSEQLDKKYPSDYLPEILEQIINVVKNTLYNLNDVLGRMYQSTNNMKDEMKRFVTKTEMEIVVNEIQKRFVELEKRVKKLGG